MFHAFFYVLFAMFLASFVFSVVEAIDNPSKNINWIAGVLTFVASLYIIV